MHLAPCTRRVYFITLLHQIRATFSCDSLKDMCTFVLDDMLFFSDAIKL